MFNKFFYSTKLKYSPYLVHFGPFLSLQLAKNRLAPQHLLRAVATHENDYESDMFELSKLVLSASRVTKRVKNMVKILGLEPGFIVVNNL